MPKPEPIIVSRVCSECGLPWDDHAKPTLAECVRLLRAALAARPVASWTVSSGAHAYPLTSGASNVTYIQPTEETG